MVNKIKNTLATYDPNEFMPIKRNGKLDNRLKFIVYKIKSPIVNYVEFVLEG